MFLSRLAAVPNSIHKTAYITVLCKFLILQFAWNQHTFINYGHFEGDADDSHQVWSGDQWAQDGSDTQRLTFTCIDQLWKKEQER